MTKSTRTGQKTYRTCSDRPSQGCSDMWPRTYSIWYVHLNILHLVCLTKCKSLSLSQHTPFSMSLAKHTTSWMSYSIYRYSMCNAKHNILDLVCLQQKHTTSWMTYTTYIQVFHVMPKHNILDLVCLVQHTPSGKYNVPHMECLSIYQWYFYPTLNLAKALIVSCMR